MNKKKILTTFKAILVYSKAVPLETYVDIEKKMREQNFVIRIIGLVS